MINCPRLLNTMYGMIKPLFNERVREMIQFHDSLESLHQEVDQSILPEELGGKAGKFDNSECAQAVLSMEDYFKSIQKYVYQ